MCLHFEEVAGWIPDFNLDTRSLPANPLGCSFAGVLL